MRTQSWCILVALAIALEVTRAHAQPSPDDPALSFEASVPRYALVFANETYPSNPLRSAAKDADVIQRKLEALRFKVIVERNRSASQIKAAIESLRTREVRFARNQHLRPVVVIYFSGHGFESNHTEYLAGIYADTASGRDLRRESLARDFIEDAFAHEAYLIFLVDACRVEQSGDESELPDDTSAQAADYQIDFASHEPIPADQTPASSYEEPERDSPQRIIGFSTWRGDTAAAQDDLDSAEIKPSVYTEALDDALGRTEALIASELADAAAYVQRNYGDLNLYPDQLGYIHIALLDGPNRATQIEADWEAVRSAPTKDSIDSHLMRFPESRHAAAARRWIARPRNE